MSKCIETGQDPDRALYEWRNVHKSDGYSPAQLLFGRKQFTSLPAADSHYDFYNVQTAKECKDKAFLQANNYHDRQKRFLPPLPIGVVVRLQDPKSGRWLLTSTIISQRSDGLSYEVDVDGRILTCSRKMIRLEGVSSSDQSPASAPRDNAVPISGHNQLRRS